MIHINNNHTELFNYLIDLAGIFNQGTILANEAMLDILKIPHHREKMFHLEHRADQINQEIITQLSCIFVTPIDREDFYKLACNLEDCVDRMHDFLMRTELYHMKESTTAAIQITTLLIDMSAALVELFQLLKNISKNESVLMKKSTHLGTIESAVDTIYRKEISRIFEGNIPLLDIIKWQDLLNILENTSDQVEYLSNILKEVIMKYA
ncbi:DUF47 family protein [Megasphaera paucivorans]|uniref:Phosphate transport regulator (Distant homolog of PhoU) n=1 Tax=Megasphaera paucivorans TaxID=349095 RepID=A0A1G9Y9K4_9FIRM|nr:DUF47 family protein [Megasphaera paucivorans]SDN05103.1 hypothetical protein SAMN05660299_02013 [Megasphaera paucivorans]